MQANTVVLLLLFFRRYTYVCSVFYFVKKGRYFCGNENSAGRKNPKNVLDIENF
nr:MAG TPA: hypothetical protein [Caudoviricetes sp.]